MRLYPLRHLLSALAVLLVLSGCAGAPLPGDRTTEASHALTILHTNDHHGRFWKNTNGEYGLAARKTLADRVRAEVQGQGGDVLLLDAGDINTGVPESDLLNAEPDIRGMNAMGYDAMAVGNHEFDHPLDVLRKQEKTMNFPLLAANIYDTHGQRLFTPYHLFTLHGLKVAVFGLTTETTAVIGNPAHTRGLTFRPAIDEARDLVPLLRQKADVVIALAHLGYREDGVSSGQDVGSVALARAVPGIDLIVDGHSHTELGAPVVENGTIIVQAGEYGKYLGRVNLQCRNGQVQLAGGSLLPVNMTKTVDQNADKVRVPIAPPIAEDAAMLALLEPFQEQGSKALLTVIGSSNGVFTGDRAVIRSTETDLGNLACLALMEKTGADVAVMNSGGIRADLPAGAITYKDVLSVKPFGNTVCTVVMSGAQLADYLKVAASMTPGSGAFAQFGGIAFLLRDGELDNVRVGGKALNPAAAYTVAMESYLASGGDGYPKVSDHPSFVDTGFVDADVLREYIAAHSPLDARAYAPTGDIRRQ